MSNRITCCIASMSAFKNIDWCCCARSPSPKTTPQSRCSSVSTIPRPTFFIMLSWCVILSYLALSSLQSQSLFWNIHTRKRRTAPVVIHCHPRIKVELIVHTQSSTLTTFRPILYSNAKIPFRMLVWCFRTGDPFFGGGFVEHKRRRGKETIGWKC